MHIAILTFEGFNELDSLIAFATPGEFEPVTFALYPVRSLQNVKVRVSPLTCSSGEIPAGNVDVRLATYWNVGFPSYTTVNTYRRTPELLERVGHVGGRADAAEREVPSLAGESPRDRQADSARASRDQRGVRQRRAHRRCSSAAALSAGSGAKNAR